MIVNITMFYNELQNMQKSCRKTVFCEDCKFKRKCDFIKWFSGINKYPDSWTKRDINRMYKMFKKETKLK